MKLQKWNWSTRTYKDYKTPSGWNTPIYTDDMYEIINCTNCGKLKRYGQCYTSLEIHNSHGLGYPVCYKCYNEEHSRRRLYKQ